MVETAERPVPRPHDDAPADHDRRPRDRTFLWLLVAALVVGGALRVVVGLTDDAPTSDETAYLGSGTSLVDGDGFARGGRPELHFPPFVPFLLGMASKVFADPHTGAVWVSIVAGTAAIAPLALLARRLAGDLAGGAAAWVAALAPGLATLPATRGSGSEAVYVLVIVTALWLVASSASHVGIPRLVRVAGSGLMVGLAYLTRPEGLFVAAPIGLAALWLATRDRSAGRERRRGVVVAAAAFAAPLLLCVAPYAAFLHDHTGRWELTAKTQDVSIDAWHAVARGDRHDRDAVLYALDDTGLRFDDERTSLTSLALDDPGGYLEIFGTNVRVLGKNIAGVALLPLPVWALAAYGAWRARRSRLVLLLGGVSALPVLTALAFFVMPRYLVVVAAVGAVLAGVGATHLPHRHRRLVLGALAVMLAVSSVQALRGGAGWFHPDEHTDQRRAGEWLAEHTDDDDLVMTRSMVVEHYNGRRALPIPYADPDEIMAFARHYGAQYLVVDEAHVERLRPQLLPLFTDDDHDGLRLVHELEAEGRTTRIFALDPAPPPSDEEGPALGFMGDA